MPERYEVGRVVLRLRNGTYYARYRNGARRRFEKTTKKQTLEAAIAVARRINDELELHGDFRPTGGTQTVHQTWTEFLGKYMGWGTENTQCATYFYNKAVEPAIGNLPVASVRPVDLLNLLERAEKEAGGWGPSNWNHKVQYLATFFKWASNPARAYCPTNPARAIDRRSEPEYGDQIPDALSDEDLDRLLAYLKDVSLSTDAYYIVLLSVDTGMRQGELGALTWDCIDFDNRQFLVLDTKSGTDRVVPMTSRVLAEVLARFNRVQKLEGSLEAHPPVPHSRKGKGKRKGSGDGILNITKALKSAKVALGLPKLTRHMLRHTAATRWGEMMEVDQVKKALGHKKLDMTLRYMKTRDKRLHDGFKQFDAAIGA
tara:strand:+ start:4229 stop:5344 length:1116 start_codon:yes stop_codon:yes gene_type:complete